ncbi:Phage portal protein, SPP1 Gp6-like [Curtobacterium sp. 9128]|uniref:phage portal protein n=1 Tax=Curtobacterium sp. 9128 TaxID=1793722 RepID=UPI0007D72A55|nr:phage portal protein [Curtobacterium sp. 9128]SBN64447.1 Phage portal protein, SPP1 Gp6-like [Curtobacterium sp. 9128]
MPQPADVWPPQPWDIAFARFAEHDAWYVGDTATLADIYQGKSGPTTHVRSGVPYRGGVIGALSKMWWGQRQDTADNRMKMHLPVPADIAQLSADLLFAEAPKIRYPKPDNVAAAEQAAGGKPAAQWKHPGQDRLDTIMGSDEAHAEMLNGGELSASSGGTYWAVTWDEALRDHVWFRAFSHDCAIPEFRYGVLTGVTLWTEYDTTDRGGAVYRLLERHGPGLITYELHEGGPANLGRPVPMSTLPETAHYESLRSAAELEPFADAPDLAALANPAVTVATGVPKLAVKYMPNVRPSRDWRKLGPLANLGRSDYAGIEDLFDKIDQAWSSLMRDLENGQGRLTVPEQMLDTGKPGEGATFDVNRSVYVGVQTLASSEKLADQIVNTQFDIRVQEHLETIDALKREIATTCGYSPVHLGLRDVQQAQRTATEVTADLSDSERTRDKKALYAKPALAELAQVALAIDGIVFPGKGGQWFDELPDVEFAEVSQVDPLKNAQTISMLDAARAVSTLTRVRMAGQVPDEEIESEVQRIRDEDALGAMRDPASALFDATEHEDEEPDDGDEQQLAGAAAGTA